MNSTVSVWTSSLTSKAESEVARIVREAPGAASVYDHIAASGLTESELTIRLTEAFNKLVKMTMSDTTLHVVGIVPLSNDAADLQIKTLAKACAGVRHDITLHVIGLRSGICRLFGIAETSESLATEQKNIDELKASSADSHLSISFSLIDDYVANGAPVRFTINSFAHYLAVFQLTLAKDYYAVLSPSMLASHRGQNISIGLSTLKFDRTATARQLLGLGFLSALDNVGINRREVDAQKASHAAEQFLSGISDRYPILFREQIRPLYKDKGFEEGRVVAMASDILDADISDLRDSILSLLHSDSMSLPEKEAVLSQILGRDNENIRGVHYEQETTIIDDACTEPIDIFINAFNDYCPDSHLLPIRSDFEALKLYDFNLSTLEMEESPQNKKALNPLSDLKKLKRSILNTTAYIRNKTEELSDLQKANDRRENVVEIRKKWSRPPGNPDTVIFKEQPLDDKYIPTAGLERKKSVDLRKFFSPVRDQLKLGSCTSFAVTGMYEAMMNIRNFSGDNVMSPAYLYYYSNVCTGRPEGGSNFYEQLEVLGKRGVCQEYMYPYKPDDTSEAPTEAAEAEAAKHRVLSAKQIMLVDTADKKATIDKNHELLTSALSEGFPVGISLRIFDVFGKDGSFILHPDDCPEKTDIGFHAMVIAGYSEENDIYIVRNSWGEDFGDNGYCYIPSVYIDDPDYLSFACIITETTDSVASNSAEIPPLIAEFAATESEIQAAAIRNVISKTKVELNCNIRIYKEYYKYYQRLIQQLAIPKVQEDIRKAAQTASTLHYIELDKEREKLESSFVAKLKEYKKAMRYVIAWLLLAAVISGLLYYVIRENVVGITALVFSILGAFAWAGYKWNVRRRRRELQEELDHIATRVARKSEELLEMQIKFHVAGMWLSRFHHLSRDLGTVYDRLVSYNSTLCGWRQFYSNSVDTLEEPDGPMFRILDPTKLLQSFFDANKTWIVGKIDLMKVFDEYQVSADNLEKSHETLRKSVGSATTALMADFDITEFLTGADYPYLSPVNLQEEIAQMLAVGQPTHKNTAVEVATPMRLLMACVDSDRKTRWLSTITPYFPLQPMHLDSNDKLSLTLLTLHPLPV